MLQKMFSIRVSNKNDMARLEEVVIGLLGGEHHRCAFLRSGEYQRFRNEALYSPASSTSELSGSTFPRTSVHIEGLKLTLTPTRIACVYVTDPCVVPVPPPPTTNAGITREDEEYAVSSLVGRKRRAATPPSDEDACDLEEETGV
jgi:hypothetical protein